MGTVGLSILSIVLSSGALIALCGFCISIGQYKEKVLNHEKILGKTLSPKVDNIHGLLIKVTTWLHNQYGMPDMYVQRSSPVNLTLDGEEMLQKSGLKDLIDFRLEYLKKQIESKEPATNYDKQQLCYEILLMEKDQEFMNPIKEYAFTEGADFMNMLFAGSIYLSKHLVSG